MEVYVQTQNYDIPRSRAAMTAVLYGMMSFLQEKEKAELAIVLYAQKWPECAEVCKAIRDNLVQKLMGQNERGGQWA